EGRGDIKDNHHGIGTCDHQPSSAPFRIAALKAQVKADAKAKLAFNACLAEIGAAIVQPICVSIHPVTRLRAVEPQLERQGARAGAFYAGYKNVVRMGDKALASKFGCVVVDAGS